MNAQDKKIAKAKELRYKKPIVKNLNLEYIKQDLWDIQELCEGVRWYTDSEDGEDTLINALLGDEDEAYEFKMAFADLCAECDRLFEDVNEEWIPECFDLFFVSIGAGKGYGGLLGYDEWEQDYFGLNDDYVALYEAKKILKRLTKDELISASMQCFRVYSAYIGLRNRYDCLKAAIDILRDQNTGYLQVVKEIERLYEEASDEWEWKEFERYTNCLPVEAWIA